MIVTTLYIIVIALTISVPVGIFTAIYLVEYAKRGSKFVMFVRLATESLAGIPSILFGLFGLLFFVISLKWSWSILAGALTLSIMVLPTIIRSTEEALKSVTDSYREGSYGLGAGKVRTVFSIILPSAIPGILAAIILSIGRIVGETAAVLLTAGTVAKIPNTLFQSGRTLAVHMYVLAKEGIDFGTAYATAFVLMVIVLTINISASVLIKKFRKE
jgi:phosphate transport system permease protein